MQPISRMFCMDGNNSLKRMCLLGGRKVGDSRVYEGSDYYLPQTFVNKFADEVRTSRSQNDTGLAPSDAPHVSASDDMDVDDPETDTRTSDNFGGEPGLPLGQPCASASSVRSDQPEEPSSSTIAAVPAATAASAGDVLIPSALPESRPAAASPEATRNSPNQEVIVEGDPTDGDPATSTCTKNWKAAQSDEKKRSWDVFDETGIFASACRHGFMLWVIDMVRSGEL